MKIRILTDEDGNILAFAKTGGVEWHLQYIMLLLKLSL